MFKRLRNIESKREDQSKKQLDAIKNINISSKPLKTIGFFSTLSDETKKLMVNIKQLDGWLDKTQFICTKTDGKTIYNFSHFTSPLKFASKIYNKDFTLKEAEDNQQELEILINKLSNKYNPLNKIKRTEKNDTLESAKKLFNIRKEITRAFKRGIFPYIDGFKVDEELDEELDENKFFNESEGINYELFEKHFKFAVATIVEKTLFETKNKNKNNALVNVINSGLRDL